MARKSAASHLRRRWKLKPAAARTALIRSPSPTFEVVAVHSMIGLDVTDHRLDGGAALHLAFEWRRWSAGPGR
jgi:hypothetical protein